MKEQDALKKQLVVHMLYILAAFALIFSVFGMIIAFAFKYITYSSIDQELINTANIFIQDNEELENISDYFLKDGYSNFENFDDKLREIRDYNLSRKVKNPKYTVIVRDGNGKTLNIGDLGLYYEENDMLISFDKNNINKVYTLNFAGNSSYRAINVKLDSEKAENVRYVQILLNADSEKMLVDNFGKLVINSVVVGILLSVFASFVLSRKTLRPIEIAFEKQTEFVQNASHELRTPLTIIQAKQELLLTEPNSKIIDKSEDIALTLNETKRLTKLTKDLMTLASSNKMELEKENVNIDELIQSTVNPYIEVANLSEKELKLDLKYGKNVEIDVNKIQQLIIILLDNALKYTEAKDSIEIVSYLKDGKCNIEVRDTGIGISDNGIKEVFNRFYREDAARNRETGGSGLGLSIADTIVKAHNGTIKALHNNPKGTIFTVKLPKI
ncbi:MAG: HAMP domain-containing histidine kinase [Clostridia bacterium]|nr:HAMP domain-containing histidine kinase [Clostridia bacterium]